MAIVIIKKGNLPSDREYTTTCRTCQTQFKFKQSDGSYTSDQRDGDCVKIACPLCKTDAYVNAK